MPHRPQGSTGLRKQEPNPLRPSDPHPSLQPHHMQPITGHQDYIFPHFTTVALFLSPTRLSSRGLKPHLVSEASVHTEVTAGREGPFCDPLTLPRSLRFGGQVNCSQKAEMPQAELYRAGAHYPHCYLQKQRRYNLGRSSNGGDPDLDLPRGSWKEDRGTLTASWV